MYEKCSHRFWHLNTWSPVGGAVWRFLGDAALWWEICHSGRLWQSEILIISLLPACIPAYERSAAPSSNHPASYQASALPSWTPSPLKTGSSLRELPNLRAYLLGNSSPEKLGLCQFSSWATLGKWNALNFQVCSENPKSRLLTACRRLLAGVCPGKFKWHCSGTATVRKAYIRSWCLRSWLPVIWESWAPDKERQSVSGCGLEIRTHTGSSLEEEQIYIIVPVGLEAGLQQRDRNNTFSFSSRCLPASRVLVLQPCGSVPWSGLRLLFAQLGVSSSELYTLRCMLGNLSWTERVTMYTGQAQNGAITVLL